jgi:transposase
MKHGIAYKRFRHFGKDKVTMDFAFFAIAFNIKKMLSNIVKTGQKRGICPIQACFCLFCGFCPLRIEYFWENAINQSHENIETSKHKNRECIVKS